MRDLFVTVAAVLREAYWLATERRGSSATRDVPACAATVTPAWLTHALQASFPNVRVQTATPLSSEVGTTDRVRMALTYDRVGEGAPPASLFVKLAPADFKVRLFVNLMRLGTTEVRFYREVAAHLRIQVPRVFHAAVGGRAQRFAIVFEDLTAPGVRFATAADPVSVEDARHVMRALARLHASFWDDPRLRGDLGWLRSRRRNPRYRVERGLCALAMRPGMRRFPELVPAELQAAAAGISAARDRLEDAWAQGPLTLIHGDAHVGNMYFVPNGVGLLDWQVVQCGQGMRDVAYFLINSLATDLRRAHQDELIALYLATLAAAGVTPPDFAGAWEQYRLHALYAWIGAVVTAAAASLQSEAIVRAALGRGCVAVSDVGSLAALAGLT